ncbi:MAG: hypothetical protein OXH81_10540 [Gemmatimonadetes bacterium]|nr:hypothetical protein [Gemmatimonadota bacterium]MDE2734162.1 hypothetical protein [Gemmatimonadota bacterium]
MTTTRRTPSNTKIKQAGNGATTGYEAELWQMADALRGSMDAAIAENLEKLGFGER